MRGRSHRGEGPEGQRQAGGRANRPAQKRFRSAILPPYMRRSPKVSEVLPLLYLHGLSSGDFAPALREFFGSEAGLSPATVVRLSESNGKRNASRS